MTNRPTRTPSSGSRRNSHRVSRTESNIYRRYSQVSDHGESTVELGPTQSIAVSQENGRDPDDTTTKNGTQDSYDDTQENEVAHHSTALRGGRWYLIVVAILINTFVYAIDNTIVAVIQPVSVGFILGGTATALPLTGLYSALDAKWLYIACTLLFTAASALCGAAPTISALIVGRVLAGIGGNGMYLGAIILLSVFSDPGKTSLYIGFIGLSWGAGTVIGPLIGGALESSSLGWRWAFYINVIIGGVSLPILLKLTPNFRPRPLDMSAKQALSNIDWAGAVLSVPAFVFLITAINFGGTRFKWDGAFTVSFFWAAGVFFLAFWLQQLLRFKTTLATRLFPIHLFAKKDMLLLFIIQATVGGIVVVPLYLLALYYPYAKDSTAIEAGVKLLPLVLFLVAAIILNGYAMGVWGFHQVWIITGSVFVLLSGIFLSRITVDTPDATLYGLQIILGTGTGAFSQAGFAIAQALVSPEEIQHAISFMLIAQLTGTSLGLGISGAIFQNLSVPRVAKVLGPNYTIEQVTRIVSRIDNSLIASLPAEVYRQAQGVVVNSIANGLALIYAGGALCLLCGFLLAPNVKLLATKIA
ncbi:major facilitator superfamily domain-containing protein [Xylaria arbuscula]|nr:major facilitator superfamily domain-containing protein [Xylaria arbuscula]